MWASHLAISASRGSPRPDEDASTGKAFPLSCQSEDSACSRRIPQSLRSLRQARKTDPECADAASWPGLLLRSPSRGRKPELQAPQDGLHKAGSRGNCCRGFAQKARPVGYSPGLCKSRQHLPVRAGLGASQNTVEIVALDSKLETLDSWDKRSCTDDMGRGVSPESAVAYPADFTAAFNLAALQYGDIHPQMIRSSKAVAHGTTRLRAPFGHSLSR